MHIPIEIVNIILDYADSIFVLTIDKKSNTEQLKIKGSHHSFAKVHKIFGSCTFSHEIEYNNHKLFQIVYEIQKKYISAHSELDNIQSQTHYMVLCVTKEDEQFRVTHVVNTVIETTSSAYLTNSTNLPSVYG
jgi:hypothetical protein